MSSGQQAGAAKAEGWDSNAEGISLARASRKPDSVVDKLSHEYKRGAGLGTNVSGFVSFVMTGEESMSVAPRGRCH